MIDDMLSRNFSRHEFACKCGCGFANINPRIVELSQAIRTATGLPVRVNSGCRCQHHNEAVGGVPRSDHTKGNAADLSCPEMGYRKFRGIVREVAARFAGVYVIYYADQRFCHVGWRKPAS